MDKATSHRKAKALLGRLCRAYKLPTPTLYTAAMPEGYEGAWAVSCDEQWAIWLNLGLNRSLADLQDSVRHEAAHLVTWRRHGRGVQDHGKEWKVIAQEMGADPRASPEAKP